MIEEEKYKTHSKYYLYSIVNKKSGPKQGKKFYIVSSISDPEKFSTVVRGMVHSKTTLGGTKAISKDMSASKDYHSDFDVKIVHRGSKEQCQVLKNKLMGKSPQNKVYNVDRS